MFCGHATRIGKSLADLAREGEFKNMGTGLPPVVDGGAKGFDEGVLIRAGGDGLETADRIERGSRCPTIGFNICLRRVAVSGAENDVLLADSSAVEVAFGLKGELNPRGVSVDQCGSGFRQIGYGQRGIKHDRNRDYGDDRCGNRNLADDRNIPESEQHSPLPWYTIYHKRQTLRTRSVSPTSAGPRKILTIR
ncbi:hypothetical protein GALL_520610 [mine drainage metagenome]|uniref:Uncharacterized protein n=1 Tax=mine drainage metagenome TaxID=410659 RepID=A0A1J5P6I0_9ZZZZ